MGLPGVGNGLLEMYEYSYKAYYISVHSKALKLEQCYRHDLCRLGGLEDNAVKAQQSYPRSHKPERHENNVLTCCRVW